MVQSLGRLSVSIDHKSAPIAYDAATARSDALATYDERKREIAQLRSRAAKEKQTNRRVELNLTIKRLEGELAKIEERLQGSTCKN